MIKNYNILRKFELNLQREREKTPEDSLIAMNNMFYFSEKFKNNTAPEKTHHVRMLLNMTSLFKKIQKAKNDTSRKLSN